MKKSYSRSSSRTSSLGGGRGSSSTTTTTTSTRPPVILQFHEEISVVSGGFADGRRAFPKHSFKLPTAAVWPITSAHAAQVLFQRYAATVEKLLLTLIGGGGGGGGGLLRVVVLHTDLLLNRHWKLAVIRILQDVCRVSAVHFVSVISMVPLALPASPTLLAVHFSYTGFQCLVYGEYCVLEYTYQSSEYYDDDNINASTLLQTPRTVGELRRLQSGSGSMDVLITALCLCLQQCPMSIRKAAIHNILLSGTVVVDNYGHAIAKKLYQYLQSDNNNDESKDEIMVKKEKDEKQPPQQSSPSPSPTSIVYTSLPVNKRLLKPLANHIGVLDTGNGGGEHLAWIGASVWVQQSASAEEDIIPWTDLTA